MDSEHPASSRALLLEHARGTAELADRHALTLESLLALLRSDKVDDRAARAVLSALKESVGSATP